MLNLIFLILSTSSLTIMLSLFYSFSIGISYALSSLSFDDNTTDSNLDCIEKENTYIITLNEFIGSVNLKHTLDELVYKLNSSGIKIVNVLENTGIIIIEPVDNKIFYKISNELKNDVRVKSIEKSGCVTTSNPNN